MPVFYCCLLYLAATLVTLRTLAVLGFAPNKNDPGECTAFFILGALWPVFVPAATLAWSSVKFLERFVAPFSTWLVSLIIRDEGSHT